MTGETFTHSLTDNCDVMMITSGYFNIELVCYCVHAALFNKVIVHVASSTNDQIFITFAVNDTALQLCNGIVCCHGDRTVLGNVTTDDVTVTSLMYMNLTSLHTYLNVLLQLTLVCMSVCMSVRLCPLICSFVSL